MYQNYDELIKKIDWSMIMVVVLCGLPGSGKSTLGERLADELGYIYLSSDKSRVEILKLTVGKLGTNEEYVNYTPKVYEYMRKELQKTIGANKRIILDATHLNNQREITLEYCHELGLGNNEVLIIYVNAGKREEVLRRISTTRNGDNLDGRTLEEAWAAAYDFFVAKIKNGEVVVPKDQEKGYKVVWVKNY